MADRNEETKKAVDVVLGTEEGRLVFAHIFHLCSYNMNSSVVDPRNSEILPSSSAYNDGRRSVYVGLRRLASYDLLKAAEDLAERPVPAAPASKEEK